MSSGGEQDMAEETDPTPEEQILINALAPKRVTGDSGSAEQHPIGDQIEALKLARSASAATRTHRGLGIRHTKLVPPGND
jgi:hypothetical protein